MTARAPPVPSAHDEMLVLLADSWLVVQRSGRRIATAKGIVGRGALLSTIAHALSLGRRDLPVLDHVLGTALAPPGSADAAVAVAAAAAAAGVSYGVAASAGPCEVVDLALLRETVDRGAAAAAERARLSQNAPPVVHSRKYLVENHGSPFAVGADTDESVARQRGQLALRRAKIRAALLRAGDAAPAAGAAALPRVLPPPSGGAASGGASGAGGATSGPRITRAAFHAAMARLDHGGVSRREERDILGVLDPRGAGFVDVDDFCDRFAAEFAKPKSLRSSLGAANNDGRTNVLEWRASLADSDDVGDPLRHVKLHSRRGGRRHGASGPNAHHSGGSPQRAQSARARPTTAAPWANATGTSNGSCGAGAATAAATASAVLPAGGALGSPRVTRSSALREATGVASRAAVRRAEAGIAALQSALQASLGHQSQSHASGAAAAAGEANASQGTAAVAVPRPPPRSVAAAPVPPPPLPRVALAAALGVGAGPARRVKTSVAADAVSLGNVAAA